MKELLTSTAIISLAYVAVMCLVVRMMKPRKTYKRITCSPEHTYTVTKTPVQTDELEFSEN